MPNAYETTIKAENILIQAGKISLRSPMPIFSDIQPNMPLQIPSFAPLPVVPTLQAIAQIVATKEVVVLGSSQELQDIKILLQTFCNKLVNLEKQ